MTTAVKRGCGTRVAGGIYAECPLSANGRPLEDFLMDPPVVIDPTQLGVTPVGVTLVERKGVWHIVDWVGSEHYLNVADFLEEVRRFGMSRRLPRTLDFSKLGPGSRQMLVHSRAHIENHAAYYTDTVTNDRVKCPKNLPLHHANPTTGQPPDQMCAGLWWEDVEGGEGPWDANDSRSVQRAMPSFTYNARKRPDGVEPVYKLAIFASFPIANIAVIRDPKGGTHELAEHLASQAKLPLTLEDE